MSSTPETLRPSASRKVNGKSSGLPQRTGAAGLNSRMRPASAARPSPLHSNTFFRCFSFIYFGKFEVLDHYNSHCFIEVFLKRPQQFEKMKRWQLCLQDTSPSANCHRRAAVGHCFIVCVCEVFTLFKDNSLSQFYFPGLLSLLLIHT